MRILTDDNLQDLLHRKPITAQQPWANQDETKIIDFYRSVISEIRSTDWLECQMHTDWVSGYASFVSAQFSRPREFAGLAFYFSKLSPYYVLGEGRKNSFPLDYDRLDFFDHRQVEALVAPVSSVLDNKGLVRLHKEVLAHPLPASYHGNFYTMISQPPWRHFDALFHWAD
jgi:hypothetical protein